MIPDAAQSAGLCSPAPGVSFPYFVLGESKPRLPLFHLVIVNDFFDTYEKHQIFFKPIVDKYPGLQVCSSSR